MVPIHSVSFGAWERWRLIHSLEERMANPYLSIEDRVKLRDARSFVKKSNAEVVAGVYFEAIHAPKRQDQTRAAYNRFEDQLVGAAGLSFLWSICTLVIDESFFSAISILPFVVCGGTLLALNLRIDRSDRNARKAASLTNVLEQYYDYPPLKR